MFWLVIVGAYLLGAVANILDKFLLGSKRISSATVYAFYIGIFGAGALVLAPFGLTVPSGAVLALCLFSGAIYLAGVTLLYFAIERAEASRVVPVVGAAIPLATFFLGKVFGLEKISALQMVGVGLLVVGGLLISFDLPLKLGKKKFFSGFYYALGAGLALAVAYVLFKDISENRHEAFISWYIWTRLGSLLGAVALFCVPVWRKNIFKSFSAAKRERKRAYATGGIFVSNKLIGGLSTLMLNYAIKLGSVTLINALVSLQYVFVLVFATVLSKKRGHIFQEKLFFWDWMQKIAAIALIGAGVLFVSIS